jgi:hypothetical protein
MALQNQTYANSGQPYYGHPADWSLYSTLQDTIRFNSTNAVLLVTPAIPDSNTTISFNGEQLAYVSDIPDLADWAQFPANNNVTIPAPYALNAQLANISTVNVSTLNVFETNITTINVSTLNADLAHISSIRFSTINITAERGTALAPASVNINTSNGLYGTVDVTANPGFGGAGGGNISLTANGGTAPGGLYGQVSIIANEGTATVSGTNVTTGGYINIQANSGSITSPTLTSRIDLNAGGLNLYSGILSPIASEFGYTFMNASAGVSIVAGAFSPSFQVPGSVYVYGTTGIVLGSDAYAGNIYPRFDGINPPDNLTINGRTELVGSAFVDVNDINQLSFSGDVNASKAINGLSTINGQPLSDFNYNPDPQFSTITMNNFGEIQTPFIRNLAVGADLQISQENGTGRLGLAVFVPPSGTAVGEIEIRNNGEIGLNNMTAGQGITITPTGDVLEFRSAGAPVGQIAGLATVNGNMSIGADGNSIEFIPPPPSIVTQGQISGVSTINGVAYPPPYVVNFVDAQAIYVAPNGSDSVGTGSSQFPYATIARALTARALISNTLEVSIMLSPGTYAETFTITRNTYLVGVQTGEARQPCNIVGDINMNDAAGTTGLSGLDVNGTVTTTGAAAHTIFACNITGATAIALNATAGTVFVTECRLTSSGSDVIRSSSTMNIRDCIITQSGVNNCISSSTSCTIRQCFITSTSTSTSVQPIVFFNNSNAATSEISFCNITYTSAVTSTTGEKACIAYGNTGTHTASVSNSLLICEGAIAPLGGGPILCIQAINSGALTLSYGQIIAGTNANRLPVTGLSKIPYVTAV